MYSLDLSRAILARKAVVSKRSSQLCATRQVPLRSTRVSASIVAGARSLSSSSAVRQSRFLSSQVSKNAFSGVSRGVRQYTTSVPPTEPVVASTDNFVSSAVVPTAPTDPVIGMLGVNEGFTKLMDPVHWTGFLDPVYWFIQGNIELVHSLTGLPWWGAILAYAAVIRVATFPLQIKQTRLSAVSQLMQPELAEIRKKYMYSSNTTPDGKRDWSGAMAMQKESRAVMEKHGVGPATALKFTVPQAIAMISSFFVIRSIASDETAYLHGLWTTGGAGWFENLCIADPTYILPLASCITTASLLVATPMPQFSTRTVLMISGGIAALSFWFTAAFPIAIHLFWTGSSTLSVLSTLILRNNSVRKAVGVPLVDPEAVAAAAPKPLLFDQPPTQRPKTERVAVPPAQQNAAPMKKKTRK